MFKTIFWNQFIRLEENSVNESNKPRLKQMELNQKNKFYNFFLILQGKKLHAFLSQKKKQIKTLSEQASLNSKQR